MTELKAVGLDKHEEDNNTESRKPEFGWLLTDRFEELKSRKEKYPLRHTLIFLYKTHSMRLL